MSDDLSAIGDVLIRYSARTEPSGEMTMQMRAIHDEFIADRNAESAYFKMGFLAAKAIERCYLLEEYGDASDLGSGRAGAAGRGASDAGPRTSRRGH